MGELTVKRDEDIIRVSGSLEKFESDLIFKWERFYGKNQVMLLLPDCSECIAKEKKAIQEENTDNPDVDITKLFDQIEFPMKFDPVTKHFICKRCGLFATREQVGDIRERLNRKERTRQDHQYDYLDWWQKSKKEKQQH